MYRLALHPSRPTCPQAHGHRAVLLDSAVDAQLAVAVVPPAPEAAAGPHSAGARASSGNRRDRDACAWKGHYFDAKTDPKLARRRRAAIVTI